MLGSSLILATQARSLASRRAWRLLLALALPAAGVAQERLAEQQRETWLLTLRGGGVDLRPLAAAIAASDAAAATAATRSCLAQCEADQADIAAAVRSLGGTLREHFWIFNGCAVELDAAAVTPLRQHPRVRFMHRNLSLRPVGALRPLQPIKTSTDANNHATDIVQAAGIRGAGVTLALVDTGFDYPMGTSNRPHAIAFRDGDINNTSSGGIGGSRLMSHVAVGAMPADDSIGHGTGVAGIAVGGQWNLDPRSDHGHAPHAGLASYSIANNTQGSSDSVTIVRAWQAVLADAARFGIRVANSSYSGSPDPTDPTQQAADTCALVGDVLVCVSAGNLGQSTLGSPSCANGLAIGATATTTRVVASYSSRGPLLGDPQRFYPDLCANGVEIVMPLRDDEAVGKAFLGDGTSFSSPQVAGAAVLYRSLRGGADHLETKAALLATAEDVSAQNATPPYASRNAYGLGYLRVDQLIALAQGNGLLSSASLTSGTPRVTVSYPVTAGKVYAAAIAWDRQQMSATNWSDLSLSAEAAGQPLAIADSPRNLYEKVVFLAPMSGSVDLVVTAKSLEGPVVPFALAAVEIPPSLLPGAFLAYGAGCLGTGSPSDLQVVAPVGVTQTFGNSSTALMFNATRRVQQILDASVLPPAPIVATGIAFRTDDRIPSVAQGGTLVWQLELGTTTVPPGAISATFAANVTSPLTMVVAPRTIAFPVLRGLNTVPGYFAVTIPFDAPWVLPANGHLLFDSFRSSGVTSGTLPLDAQADTTASTAGLVTAPSITAATGQVWAGLGIVLGFVTPNQGAEATLAPRGVPHIGTTYLLDVRQGRPLSVAALLSGQSRTSWGSVPLPLDLGPAGAPRCMLLTSPDIAVGLTLDGTGYANYAVVVPNDKSLLQANWFQQAAIVDQPANALGVVTTGGLHVLVGGRP